MATFSPLPSPPARARGRPSPQRRLRQVSRLSTPARTSLSGMDVDENFANTGRRVEFYAKTEQLAVTLYSELPTEVKQVLARPRDLEREFLYSGVVDTQSGYAIATSYESCFVWQYAHTIKGSPTCYIFPTPCLDSEASPPFATLIPYGATREPGLMLVSPSGHVRVWDSIGLGLAGVDHFLAYSLGLTNETVTHLARADAQLYLASTSNGRAFRINLVSIGGKLHLTSRAFSPNSSSFSISGLIPSLFGASSQVPTPPQGGCINAIALGALSPGIDSREVWILVERQIQLWKVSSGGREELVFVIDLLEPVNRALHLDTSDLSDSTSELTGLELLDVAVERDQLAVLISYTGWEGDEMMKVDTTTRRRMYATLFCTTTERSVQIEAIRSIPYESTAHSGALIHPRVQFSPGHIAVAQFGDAVGIVARDSKFGYRLALKGRSDQTIGVGIQPGGTSTLVLTTKVIMNISMDLEQIRFYNTDNGQTMALKSIILQAIMYGSNPENPLHFSFPLDIDDTGLMTAAEQVSAAVLRSDPDIVKSGQDLTNQMLGREDRLIWLIRFINENRVLPKMAQRSRQKLATDAEKMYSCHQLWLQHNDFLQESRSGDNSVLKSVVQAYMENHSTDTHHDPLRAFFRLHIDGITLLLQSVHDAVIGMSRGVAEEGLQLLPEANSIVLVVINSALEYREHNLKVYGVEFPMSRPWTSEVGIIDLTVNLFETTVKFLDATRVTSNDRLYERPRAQLPEMVAVILGCVRERLDWLTTDPSFERERSDLLQRYHSLRPDLMHTLCRFGFLNAAMSLAEKDRDFSSLVMLCHRDTLFPPESNPHIDRIQTYVNTYGENFAFPLFQWYIQHGELRLMFADVLDFGGLLDKYFEQNRHPTIAWCHQLQHQRFDEVATILETESHTSQNLGVKLFELSFGKLSHLAAGEEHINQDVLDQFHGGLDMVSVHEELLDQFSAALDNTHNRISVEARLDALVGSANAGLSERPCQAGLFKDMLRRLLDGNALSDEDLLDVLTLKNNSNTRHNFETALSLVYDGILVPESRLESTKRTIWRRLFIHDDWSSMSMSSNLTDDALTQKYKDTMMHWNPPVDKNWHPGGPGLSPQELDALEQDFAVEQDILGELRIDLDRVYSLAQRPSLSLRFDDILPFGAKGLVHFDGIILPSHHRVMQHAKVHESPENQPLTLGSRDSTDSEESLRALEVSDGPQALPTTRFAPRGRSYSVSGFDFEILPLSASLSNPEDLASPSIEKNIGVFKAIGIIVGSQIGSGIFSSPGVVVANVKSIGASLLVWLIAGLLGWTGASSYAELGSAIPVNGGSQSYLAYAYGPLVSFLFAWTAIIALKPGGAAGETTPDDLSEIGIKLTALGTIAFVTILCVATTQLSTRAGVVFTTVKVAALILVTTLGIVQLARRRQAESLRENLWKGSSTSPVRIRARSLFWDSGHSMAGTLGEMRNAERNLPRAIHGSMAIVVALFLCANVSYFVVLEKDVVAASNTVGMDFGRALFGPIGGSVFAFMVAFSCFGALNGALFTSSRLVCAAGQTGYLPKIFGRLA
ncbi:Non-repetitive/WGA-negative nucleoporin C-terminal-domain-containing protein [Flagelloscypha sp. PMI_526]|nr:Non-repetitive/WGA-negative nucleoporin C-terminal-domain-containing protein [Flagelloscypha sp. PMI_526]